MGMKLWRHSPHNVISRLRGHFLALANSMYGLAPKSLVKFVLIDKQVEIPDYISVASSCIMMDYSKLNYMYIKIIQRIKCRTFSFSSLSFSKVSLSTSLTTVGSPRRKEKKILLLQMSLLQPIQSIIHINCQESS